MNTVISQFPNPRKNFRKTLVELINAKIQYADYKLKNFMASLMNNNQTPGRASQQDNEWVNSQNKVLDTIENSSLFTTKLLYLRANITEYNSERIYQLVSDPGLEGMTLEQVKQKLKM